MEQLNFKGVQQIEKYIKEKHDLEYKEAFPSFSKEMIREAIESIIEEELNKLPKETFETTENQNSGSILSNTYNLNILTDQDKQQTESILSVLVDTALNQGVVQAVKASLKTKNAYIIDKLHDVLVDKFYEILSQK